MSCTPDKDFRNGLLRICPSPSTATTQKTMRPKSFEAGTIDDLALPSTESWWRGRSDGRTAGLSLELGCQMPIGGELKLALSNFIRPLEDQSPFFSGQFAIDSAERRYLGELYKVFFYVRFRARRYRPF